MHYQIKSGSKLEWWYVMIFFYNYKITGCFVCLSIVQVYIFSVSNVRTSFSNLPSASAANWKLIFFLEHFTSLPAPPSSFTWSWSCSSDVKNKTFSCLNLFSPPTPRHLTVLHEHPGYTGNILSQWGEIENTSFNDFHVFKLFSRCLLIEDPVMALWLSNRKQTFLTSWAVCILHY